MRRLGKQKLKEISFFFEGRELQANEGDTVAAALFVNDISVFRETVISGEERAAYCMMGVCFECLVEIDGEANRQACMTKITEGLHVNRQLGVGTSSARKEYRDEKL